MWIVDYYYEVEADFNGIYHRPDFESLDGPTFLRLASRLVYYSGAVAGKIRMDLDNPDDQPSYSTQSSEASSGRKMSMSDAMKEYGASDLDILNRESQQAGMGDLFERTTVNTSD